MDLQCRDVIYWGDIDAAGLAIVNDLRVAGVNVDSMLMDYATYEAYEQFGAWTDEKGKPILCSRRRKLPALTPTEQDIYQMLTNPSSTRVRRVEQERIPLEVAAEHLGSLLKKRRDTMGRRPVEPAPLVAVPRSSDDLSRRSCGPRGTAPARTRLTGGLALCRASRHRAAKGGPAARFPGHRTSSRRNAVSRPRLAGVLPPRMRPAGAGDRGPGSPRVEGA